MNELEAISLGTEVIRSHPIAADINFAGAKARVVNGKTTMEKLRAEFPGMDLNVKLRDYWLVEFPFWEKDEFQRSSIAVTIDPVRKEAKILEESL